MFLFRLIVIACFGLLSACATTGNGQQAYDPLEGVNRKIFAFNRGVDEAVLEPVAKTYRKVTSSPVRVGIRNFLNNLREPVNFANSLLQGQWRNAGRSTYRFGVNSIWGLFGFVDVAKREGVPRQREDFGQTLAVYGVPAGPYFVLPIFGPTNARDFLGRAVDVQLNPLSYTNYDGEAYVFWGRPVLVGLSAREKNIEVIDSLRRTALDEYAQTRSLYYQIRQRQISNGQSQDNDTLPDFDALPDFDLLPRDVTENTRPPLVTFKEGAMEMTSTIPGVVPTMVESVDQGL